MKNKVLAFIKAEIVLSISVILAVISALWVHPDSQYISYIDFRTLAILLSMMIIMAGFQKLNLFTQIGEALIGLVNNIRMISAILILLCFTLSMFITNDVALLTFVPFTVVILHMAKRDDLKIAIIVLETVAANLGSMLMPMGNPQNLYLYSLSGMTIVEFVSLCLPYAALSLLLILVLNLFCVKAERVTTPPKHEFKRNRREKARLIAYALLFVMSLLVVAHVLDYRIGLACVVIVVLALDALVLPAVDYSLIFTFIFLFIFIGNLKRIDIVSQWLGSLVIGNEAFVSVLASQFISNVPAAILLSGFTSDIKTLIIGTNLGGLGTLIASMASLISFKIYGLTEGADKGRYIKLFTLINLGLLIILYLFNMVMPS